jgi:tetratricopeptide (TPR) repeat protein
MIFAFLSASAEVDEVDPTIVSAIQYQNMGLAYLEESQPLKAVTQFEDLIGLLPNEAIGYANLAVAYLRLRQVDAAEKVIQRGITAVPLNSQLHFIYSEIYHFQGKSGQAVTELKEALRLKPDDLEVRYLLIRENLRDRRNTEAISKAIIDLRFLRELTPTNIVVLLKLSQALLLNDEDVEQVGQIGKELRILLSDIDSEKLKYLDEGMRQVEVEDIKGANRNFRIFENINKNSPRYQQGIGELITPILGHPIEEFDQRFKSRLVATQTKPIVVSFSQPVHHAMISRGQELTGLQIDYDHDGDLDNLTVFPDRIQMHRNDGNDSFLDVSDRTFSPSSDYGGQSVTSGDFDNDGDLDIIIASVSRGCLLLDNLRQGKLEVTHILSELKRPVAVDSADYDHDGTLDICVTTKIDTQLYLNRGDGVFIKDLTLMSLGGMDVHFVDYDNDGHLDVWVVDKRRMSLFRNDGTSKFSDVSSLIPTFSPLDLPVKKTTEVTSQDNASGKSDWVDGQVEDYDNDGDLDLLVGTWDDRFLIQNEGGNQNGWLQIELEAVAAGNNKNNAYGLGSRVEIKAGHLVQITGFDFNSRSQPISIILIIACSNCFQLNLQPTVLVTPFILN